MSLDLEAQIKSLKVTDDTLLWLRVVAEFTGKSHAQIAREWLHERAVKEREETVHKYRLAKAYGSGEGAAGEATATQRGLSEK